MTRNETAIGARFIAHETEFTIHYVSEYGIGANQYGITNDLDADHVDEYFHWSEILSDACVLVTK